MAEGFSRVRFTGEEILKLLDFDGEDGGLDDTLNSGRAWVSSGRQL